MTTAIRNSVKEYFESRFGRPLTLGDALSIHQIDASGIFDGFLYSWEEGVTPQIERALQKLISQGKINFSRAREIRSLTRRFGGMGTLVSPPRGNSLYPPPANDFRPHSRRR